MIIAPDFFDHWKTQALIELTKRPESPLWLQRLWAHCQTRKAWEFRDLSDLALKSICRVPVEITAASWKQALIDANFLRESGKKLIVHQWEEHNSSLVARWESGRQPKNKRRTSDGQANTKPPATDREDRLDGVEKREGKGRKASPQSPLLAEVVDFGLSLMLSLEEAHKFFDHFTANGWKQAGGNPIKDWRAAMRNWERRAAGFGKKSAGGSGAASENPNAALQVFEPEPPSAAVGGGR